MTASERIARAEEILLAEHRKSLRDASAYELHSALSKACMLEIAPAWRATEARRAEGKRAVYLSAEYLMGRLVFNNLYCMDILDQAREMLLEKGVDLALLEEVEDTALGNGGLGRLAACYLDSAATHDLPLDGYGLRYRFGLFKQKIENCRQVEVPDDWTRYGDPWSVRRDELAVVVPMKTGDVRAVPYDMPVIGYKSGKISTLRLWQAESLQELDFRLFNEQKYRLAASRKNQAEDITKVLYPNDTLKAGKQMRIKQQYMLVSASLQDMLRQLDAMGQPLEKFPDLFQAQLNDTHPSMGIPEWIRLAEARGVSFDQALDLAKRIFSYTNHTVMPEALERWDMDVLSSVQPEIARNLRRIDEACRRECGLAIVEDHQAHMARLAVYGSHHVNGVAEIHSELVKKTVFREWYEKFPEKFVNVTNGITQRRFLGLCNPELTALIKSRIGDGFLTDLPQLKNLLPHIDGMKEEFLQVKHEKKRRFAAFLKGHAGVEISPDWIFDVQVKRLHEYKRQFLNALSILDLANGVRDGSIRDFYPTVFLFGAKSAPGYVRAKSIIYLINCVAEKINADEQLRKVMQVVFVPNYNCTVAEKIIPAADLSEQISPAGTEASGTSNMKLMLNGAPTLGTYDGANVEIVAEAGMENNFIFGARVEELQALRDYNPRAIYEAEPRIRKVVDTLVDGTFPDPDGGLRELWEALLNGASWHRPDHHFLLKDFLSYQEARLTANRAYRDRQHWAEMCLKNVANAGKFSSDRAVEEYARIIWDL